MAGLDPPEQVALIAGLDPSQGNASRCETAHLRSHNSRGMLKKKTRSETAMWRKKKDVTILRVNDRELRFLLKVMLWYRNKALREGNPTEDINRVILQLSKAM